MKLVKIGVPTLFFCFLICVLIFPDFAVNNKMALVNILTFTYNGTVAVDGIGATWFVSTIMQLYLIAPILSYFTYKLKKINKGYIHILILSAIMLSGLFVIL